MGRHAELQRAVRLVLASCFLASCTTTDERTQVVLEIVADDGVVAAIDSLDVTVRGFNGETVDCAEPECWPIKLDQPPVDAAELQWPVTLPVIPQDDDAGRTFEVIVDGFSGDEVIVSTRAVMGFVDGETRTVRLRLEDACIGTLGRCSSGPECHGTTCEVCRDAECQTVGEYDFGNDTFGPTEPRDGSVALDGPLMDAGLGDRDAGGRQSDAGPDTGDGGQSTSDAGPGLDAGDSRDAGSVPDAGSLDAGAMDSGSPGCMTAVFGTSTFGTACFGE